MTVSVIISSKILIIAGSHWLDFVSVWVILTRGKVFQVNI